MLIHNYALFWRRENIFWGRPKVSGHLKGFPARKAYAEVDFREQRGVYVLYDDSFRPVYVGQAGANDNRHLFDRLKDHTRDALVDRWTKFSWFGIRWVTKTNKLASGAEGTHTKAGAVLDHIEAISAPLSPLTIDRLDVLVKSSINIYSYATKHSDRSVKQ
jgi:hypothetical protein